MNDKRSIRYRELVIKEGDTFYMTDYILPITVVAIYQNAGPSPNIVLNYGGSDFIKPASVIFNRILTGSYARGGNPRYQVGKRLSTPTSQNLLKILAVSDREGIVTGSDAAQYHYFVQLVEADGKITYSSMPESLLARYEEIGSVIIRPLPDVMDEDSQLIDLGEVTIEL